MSPDGPIVGNRNEMKRIEEYLRSQGWNKLKWSVTEGVHFEILAQRFVLGSLVELHLRITDFATNRTVLTCFSLLPLRYRYLSPKVFLAQNGYESLEELCDDLYKMVFMHLDSADTVFEKVFEKYDALATELGYPTLFQKEKTATSSH